MALNYLASIAQQIGISVVFLIIIILWEGVWKLIAMWKAAKNNSYAWFIVLAIINTVGILPILYIFVFSKIKLKNNLNKKK